MIFYEFLHFVKAEIDEKSQFKASKIPKNGIFRAFRISKIDFTQNLSDRKFCNFHTVVRMVPKMGQNGSK